MLVRDEEMGTTETYYAFSVRAKSLVPQYNHTTFFKWAPTKFKEFRVWFETTEELTLVTHYEDPNV